MSPADLAALQRLCQTLDPSVEADRNALDALARGVELDLCKLRGEWRRYQRRHPGPPFSPTIEQLPTLELAGYELAEVQLALV